MKPAQFILIQNCVINGYSLVENVFGEHFVVYDAMGSMLTTATNVKLLRRAQGLLEDLPFLDVDALAAAVAKLRDEAEVLRQSDYDHAIWRDRQITFNADNDYSGLAGCLG